MEEKIVSFINQNNKNYSLKEIKNALHLHELDHNSIKKVLEKLSNEGKIIYLEESNTWIGLNDTYKVVEIFPTAKGHLYFISDNNERIYIEPKYLNGTTAFSKVLVKKEDEQYKVIKIISRQYDKIVCEVKVENDRKVLLPVSVGVNCQIRIGQKDLKKLADGDRILVQVSNSYEDDYLNGDFVKILCHRNEPDKELISIAYSKDFTPEFSEEVLEETAKIDDSPKEEDYIGRLDLRNEVIFTIDGADTKDMDDAISLREIDNYHYP